jgi:hypothetical protein
VIIFNISLQILIIFWWIGAFISGVALLISEYKYYVIAGAVGWITVGLSSGLIIYAIKRNNKESKRNMSSHIS